MSARRASHCADHETEETVIGQVGGAPALPGSRLLDSMLPSLNSALEGKNLEQLKVMSREDWESKQK